MIRIQIKLDDSSFRLLRKLSELEHREPRIQASLLIRESLMNRMLLSGCEHLIEAKYQNKKSTKDLSNEIR
jgi:hypothetical protein